MRTLILAALAAAAAATPALAQDASFSGPRAEVIVGWDEASVPLGKMASGVTYGGAIGYDLQRGGTVFGIEGEITGSTVESEVAASATARYEGGTGRDLYVGGRLGFVATPNTLIYAKAGYSNLRTHLDYRSPTTNYDGSSIDGGYRVGAGAEFKLGSKAYLKSEYRFSDYGAGERHQVVGGLGIRF